MHPHLLHRLTDDRLHDRRRVRAHLRPGTVDAPARRPDGAVRRLRLLTGTLLVTAGTRVAGPRAGPVGLRGRTAHGSW